MSGKRSGELKGAPVPCLTTSEPRRGPSPGWMTGGQQAAVAEIRMCSLPADCGSLGGLLFSAEPALQVNLDETRSSYQFHATCQGHRPPQCSTSEPGAG